MEQPSPSTTPATSSTRTTTAGPATPGAENRSAHAGNGAAPLRSLPLVPPTLRLPAIARPPAPPLLQPAPLGAPPVAGRATPPVQTAPTGPATVAAPAPGPGPGPELIVLYDGPGGGRAPDPVLPATSTATRGAAAGTTTRVRPAATRRWARDGGLVLPEAPEHTDEASLTRTGLDWLAILAGALVVALVIKVLLLQAFVIPSESMVPTLRISERVLVNKLSYRLGDIGRGDVVVFERPPGALNGSDDSDLIKRVIGLPGEEITAVDGVVRINGEPLTEPWLPPGTVTDNLPVQVVPEGEVFVMGDNRGNSRDSRRFGTVPEDLIVGRAFLRWWPVDRVGTL